MTEDEKVVSKLLIEYFKERHECETSAYKELQEIKELGKNIRIVFESFRPKLRNIYSKYLTLKERKYTLAYKKIGSEPYYDPRYEIIESIKTETKSRIIIRTKMERNNLSQSFEYVFLKKGGKWKLDNKKAFLNFKNKWESTVL